MAKQILFGQEAMDAMMHGVTHAYFFDKRVFNRCDFIPTESLAKYKYQVWVP